MEKTPGWLPRWMDIELEEIAWQFVPALIIRDASEVDLNKISDEDILAFQRKDRRPLSAYDLEEIRGHIYGLIYCH